MDTAVMLLGFMHRLSMRWSLTFLLALSGPLLAQDPTGTIEGRVADPAGGRVPNAKVTASNPHTGFAANQRSNQDGTFHFSYLPVGEYAVSVEAKGFASANIARVRVDVDRTISLPVVLTISTATSEVSVTENASEVDVNTALGNVVSSREALDLPLNGRNLTQLGLLQPGVAAMTSGLNQAGGILRSGQAYAVNGQRPESNNYLLDGVSNVDAVNGGFAIRVPVDSTSEFRILTSNAPAEYGESSGAQTTMITKSGTNGFHGDLYDFLRNNAFDSRNFFAADTEPLHQNQFGATLGGPIRKNRDFFFGFYEGQRDRQGEPTQRSYPRRHNAPEISRASSIPRPDSLFRSSTSSPVPDSPTTPFLPR